MVLLFNHYPMPQGQRSVGVTSIDTLHIRNSLPSADHFIRCATYKMAGERCRVGFGLKDYPPTMLQSLVGSGLGLRLLLVLIVFTCVMMQGEKLFQIIQ